MVWEQACALCAAKASNTEKHQALLEGVRFPYDREAGKLSEQLRKLGLSIVTLVDEEYPQLLKEMAEPPCFLLYKGKLPAVSDSLVTVCGPFYGTAEARKEAKAFSRWLVRKGFALVSGAVSFCDRLSVRAVSESGGLAFQVVPDLAKSIKTTTGVTLLSPFLPGMKLSHSHILSLWNVEVGLSQWTFIIQPAGHNSAVRIASEALDAGRDVSLLKGSLGKGGDRLYQEGCPVFSWEGEL